MRSLIFASVLCLIRTIALAQQSSQDWLPITPRELQMAALPGEPAASAVLLYRADFRDDTDNSEFRYDRIKVFTKEGARYGNVEVSVPQSCVLQGLLARTINQAGVPISYRPDVTSVKSGDPNAVKKVLTLVFPDPGKIIEYKYRMVCSQDRDAPFWYLQGKLFTVREIFRFKPRTQMHTEVSYVSSNLPSGVAPSKTGSGIEIEMDNVPPFNSEPYMPPEANFMAKVEFFYGGAEIESPEVFWKKNGKYWYEAQEKFIGDPAQLRTTATEIVDPETDAEKKLRRLYARVQQIRNLTYEDTLSRNDPAENALNVIVRGYGQDNEITDLFAGLSRALGFETELFRTSDRRIRVFDPKLLSSAQLPSEIVRVKVNEREIFLDPGTRFCPFGLVAWNKTSVPALKLDAEGGTFMVVPTATADKSVVRRIAEGTLGSDGSFKGTVTLEFKGNEALEQRRSAPSDDLARREELRQELSDSFPQNPVLHLLELQGSSDSEAPLIARFSVEIPGFATVSKLRLQVPANLFRSKQAAGLQSTLRKYPVYFPYTFEEIDGLSLQLPAGFSVESIPNGQDVRQSSTRLITTRSLNQTTLVTTRALVVNSIYFETEQYPELRSFFNRVQQADAEQVIVKKEK